MPQITDEETPLLGDQSQNTQQTKSKKQRTPLPWRQFSILLLLQVSEPLTSQVIAPFLPQVRVRLCTFLTHGLSCVFAARVADKGHWYY